MPTLGTPLVVGVTNDEKAALQGSVGSPSASNKYLTEDDPRANPAPLTSEPTGFPNVTDSVISFVPGTRTFTIAPVVTSFDIYSGGVKYTFSSAQNVVIPNTTGLHFIYFNAAGTLVSSLTPWSFGTGLVFVATVYWNSGVPTQYILGEERHGLVMDWRTHQYLHETRRTVFVNGFGLSGYALDVDNDADVTYGVGNGQIDDEDLRHSIVHSATPTNPFEQILTDPAQIPVYYRSGAGGPWVVDAATTFPFKNTAAGRVNYNSELGGTWAQTEVTNNYYVAYWVFATNNPLSPIVSVQGQRQDSNLTDARTNNGFESLNLGTLPAVEWKILYRVIYRTNNVYGGTRKARLSAIDDFRTAALQAGLATAATAHSSLSGLPVGNDHPQYQLRAEQSLADGYPSLDGLAKIPIAEIPTAAPTQGIGAGNQEGSATSVSRSDHNHTIRESGGQDLTLGAIVDGNFLKRIGNVILGVELPVVSLPVVQARRTTQQTLTTVFVDVPLDTVSLETAPDTLERDDINTERILVKEDGVIFVWAGFSADVTSTVSIDVYNHIRFAKNGVAVAGTEVRGGNHYSATVGAYEGSATSAFAAIQCTAGDYVTMQVKRSGTAGGTVFNVLDVQFGAMVVRGSQGDQGIPGSGSSITAKSSGVNVPNTPHTALNFKDGLAAVDAGAGQADVLGGLVKTQFTELTTNASRSAATFATLISMSFTKQRADTALIIHATCAAALENNDKYGRFQLVVDSVARRGACIQTQNNEGNTIGIVIKLTGLATGIRSIELQWLAEGGETIVCRPVTNIYEHASLMVYEVRV